MLIPSEGAAKFTRLLALQRLKRQVGVAFLYSSALTNNDDVVVFGQYSNVIRAILAAATVRQKTLFACYITPL